MIKIYSTPTCPWCKKTKEFFKENNIEFQDIDVSKDQKSAIEMVEKSGQQGVPVTDFNGEIIVGFNEDKFKKLIESKK